MLSPASGSVDPVELNCTASGAAPLVGVAPATAVGRVSYCACRARSACGMVMVRSGVVMPSAQRMKTRLPDVAGAMRRFWEPATSFSTGLAIELVPLTTIDTPAGDELTDRLCSSVGSVTDFVAAAPAESVAVTRISRYESSPWSGMTVTVNTGGLLRVLIDSVAVPLAPSWSVTVSVTVYVDDPVKVCDGLGAV